MIRSIVMISHTKEERHLKTLMRLSAIAYIVVGFAFALLPEPPSLTTLAVT